MVNKVVALNTLIAVNKVIVVAAMLYSSSILAAIGIPEDGKKMTITGVVTEAIATAPDVEPSFKAHYLQLDEPMVFEDEGACGEITQHRIALNGFNLSSYQAKRVSVEGTVFCQQEYTGQYHLQDIKIKLLK
ncbi:hypothetical protein BFG52_10805 [Acinetobacter larvae]|uniref:DUF4431 domain-containing protein n=2 Tax=Acinetobacter larvae TaxID=1789224 RepID=A0A1B2M0U2_9GAMM|nr:hypothetical protein BFG52_10805 [Acinetobacter larvae]